MKRKLEILHPISPHLGTVYDGFLETLIHKSSKPELMNHEIVALPKHIVWTKRIDDLTAIFTNLEKDNPDLEELPFSKFEVRFLE